MVKKSIKAAIDLGGSGVKAIIERKGHYLAPEVIGIRPQTQVQLDNCQWVSWKEKTWLVGKLAQKYSGINALSEAKFEKGIIKTIAVLNQALEKLNAARDKRKNISLDLAVFLPPGEAEQKEYFAAELVKSLKKNESGWGHFKYQVNNLIIQPEGAGLLLYSREKMGLIKRAIIMMGFRNLSILFDDEGVVQYWPSELGFDKYLEMIREQTGLYDNPVNREVLSQLKTNINLTTAREILRTSSKDYQEKELDHLQTVIAQAQKQYLNLGISWIESKLRGERVEQLVFGGGTSDFFKEELFAYFKGKHKICWHGNYQIADKFVLGENLGKSRWIDVCILYEKLENGCS